MGRRRVRRRRAAGRHGSSPTPDGSLAVHGHAPGPEGAPTVLLYCHYDVQPPLGEDAWTSPVFELTERDGRWYGRGSADCKGNIVMHLTALRALEQADGGFPCGVKLICEGSEEQGTGGLEAFVPDERRAAARRHDPRRRHRQLRGRRPDAHDDAARHDEHRHHARGARQRDALGHVRRPGAGPGGGADPAALARCTTSTATRRSTGSTRRQKWTGVDYPAEQFRSDANVLDGAELMGDGRRRRHAVGAPVGDRARDRRAARDRLLVRDPGLGRRARQPADPERHRPARRRRTRSSSTCAARVPWGLRCTIERVAVGDPFVGSLDGPRLRVDEERRWRRRTGAE